MKKILVTLASLAVALAASFGLASAHPTEEPAPAAEATLNSTTGVVLDDEADLDQEGDDVDMDEPETADANGAAENKAGHDDGDDDNDVDDENEHEDDD
jgi:hypothetical protein